MTEMKYNYILGLMKLYSYCLQIAGLKRTQASVVDFSLVFLTRIFCEKILSVILVTSLQILLLLVIIILISVELYYNYL